MAGLDLIVRDVAEAAPLVRSLLLASADGSPLPPAEAGSHVRVDLPGGGDRAYSIVDLLSRPDDAGLWRLGVRLEDPGTGGSRYMHALSAGDRLRCSAPVNRFPLHDGAAPAILLAGGIGITPLASMASRLVREGRAFALHYAGRSQGALAFVADLRAICGSRLTEHYDDDPATRIDVAAVLAAAPPGAHVYVCGPAGMITAVRETAAAAGVPAERVHFELFAGVDGDGGDGFEVEVKSSGLVVRVGPGQSIVDALEGAGVDVVYDCRRGDCGICRCDVLDGIPDHRDVVLSEAEKASNKTMQICVSRSKTPRLLLDL